MHLASFFLCQDEFWYAKNFAASMPISIINDKNKMLANCLIEKGSTDVLNDVVLFWLQYNYYHLVHGYAPKDQYRRHNLS